jgi:hypothetical protein
LVGNVLVDSDQDVETSSLGRFQELSILQSRQISSEQSGTRDRETEGAVARPRTRQSVAASGARQQELLSFLKGFNSQGAGNGRESFQEIL